MTDGVATLGNFPADDRGRISRKTLPFIVLGVAAFAFGTAMGVWNSASDDTAVDEAALESTDIAPATTGSLGESRIAKSFGALAPRASTVAKTTAGPATKYAAAKSPANKYPYVALFFDPGFAKGSAVAFSQTGPVTPDYPLSPKTTMARNQKVRVPNVDISLASIPEPDTLLPLPAQPAPQLALSVPMPRSRPADMRLPASDGPSRQDVAKEIAQLNNKTSVVATLSPDKRTLLQKLFGAPETGPVLAYAGTDGGILSNGDSATPGKLPPLDQQTAVYDISARTVYMPDGSKLEAHSGLGSLLDDPRHVHVRMRGATPPALYDLTMRERLFHGVQALRLNPVGSDVFGRTGLLAHTYMLGPNGDSNGCVSFKNYETFLRAYQNGKVKRLAVVARLS